MRKKVATKMAQKKRTVSSGTVASGTVQRKRKTFDQVHNEGFDWGIRSSMDAMLGQGESRDYIAWTFICQDISFPFTNDPVYKGLWAYEDWESWVAAE